MGKRIFGICTLIFTLIHASYAQKKAKVKQERSPKQELSYTDKAYIPEITSVEFYNAEKEHSFPLIYLGSNELLELSFDDLRADIRAFYYQIEHCDVNWKKSNLSPLEYSSGYNEERIRSVTNSQNTLQKFSHYQVRFPTPNTTPLISGNYLLKVYEDADQSRLILTRRFYVVDEKATVNAEVVPSMDVRNRKSHQKVELTVNTNQLTINNPNRDIQVLVMQNNRQDVQIWEDKPSSIRGGELIYKHLNQFNFQGGQEFLYADLRSFRLKSSTMMSLVSDTSIRVELFADNYLDPVNYNETIDDNGRFYIRNLDQSGDFGIISDYAETTFTLNSSLAPESNIYLLGAFNNFSRDENSKLRYDTGSKSWKITKLLKQGVYDYMYATDAIPSFYETKNNYQIIVYYRNPRLNRDEIVGFHELNSFL